MLALEVGLAIEAEERAEGVPLLLIEKCLKLAPIPDVELPLLAFGIGVE